MPPKFLQELATENQKFSENQKESEINDLKELEINFSAPNYLEIIASHLPNATAISKLLYLVYNELNYLFDYLDYQVVIQEEKVIDKKIVKEYFTFLFSTPFLWKDKKDLIFFCEQKDLLENFTLRRNNIYLPFPDDSTILNEWKKKLTNLREI